MKKILIFLFCLLPTIAFAQTWRADSQIAVKSTVIPNNTNIINVKTSGGNVYSVDGFNNGTALAYIKLFNKANAVCGTDTPYVNYMIPFGQSSSGGGFTIPNINGDAYKDGISYCVTASIDITDNTAVPASTYIVNVHYR